MRDEDALRHPVIFRQQVPEQLQHLFPVQGIAAVYKQRFTGTAQDRRIASAGRFDQDDLCVLRDLVPGDAGNEGFAPAHGKEFCELADAFEGLEWRKAFLIKHLHHQVGIYKQLIPLCFRKADQLHQPGNEGLIEDAVVIYPLGMIVIQDPDRAELLRLPHERLQRVLVFQEQSHLEGLVG